MKRQPVLIWHLRNNLNSQVWFGGGGWLDCQIQGQTQKGPRELQRKCRGGRVAPRGGDARPWAVFFCLC